MGKLDEKPKEIGINKVSVQIGDIVIGIESSDESTEKTCDLALAMLRHIVGTKGGQIEQVPSDAEPGAELAGDLTGQKEYETLLAGIK